MKDRIVRRWTLWNKNIIAVAPKLYQRLLKNDGTEIEVIDDTISMIKEPNSIELSVVCEMINSE